MNGFKEQKGVTMISLVIIIIVLIILATMVTQTGMSSIKNSRFERFKSELDIVQANVDIWYQKYIDYASDEITIGLNVPDGKKEELSKQLEIVYNKVNRNELQISLDINRYRYFSPIEFENLQIYGVENDYIIDIKKQVAIVVDGYEFEDNNYYMIDQVKNVTRGGSNINEVVRISSLTLNKTSLKLEMETEATITATIAPLDATENIIWLSNDEDIVTIKQTSGENNCNVKIKTKKSGTTTITAAGADGRKLATCQIIVLNYRSYITRVNVFDNNSIKEGWHTCGEIQFGNKNILSITGNGKFSIPSKWNNITLGLRIRAYDGNDWTTLWENYEVMGSSGGRKEIKKEFSLLPNKRYIKIVCEFYNSSQITKAFFGDNYKETIYNLTITYNDDN